MAEQLVELQPDETHPVRLAVLRADTPTKEVRFAEDTWPGALHLGLRVDGAVVATSTWIPRECAALPGRHAIQLRGMATMQHLQGTGAGGRLLQAGLTRAREQGAELVWANARDAALGFYERHGFHVVGDGFVDPVTELPHHVIVLELS